MQLRRNLRKAIRGLLSTREYVDLAELLPLVPRMKYLSPDRIKDALDDLAAELNFHRQGDPPDQVYLLKRR